MALEIKLYLMNEEIFQKFWVKLSPYFFSKQLYCDYINISNITT